MVRVDLVSEAPRIGAAGTRIVCPNPGCWALIGRLVKEVRDFVAVAGPEFRGDVGTDAIEFAPGQRHVAGEQACCTACGTPYLIRERRPLRGITELFLHTDIGWIPRIPMSQGGDAPPEWGELERV